MQHHLSQRSTDLQITCRLGGGWVMTVDSEAPPNTFQLSVLVQSSSPHHLIASSPHRFSLSVSFAVAAGGVSSARSLPDGSSWWRAHSMLN
ncbi:hypothetical protein EYF80_043736 [Liparis tanakae]|uniref:Uncharacterized protein n=1 Tax=Liparis tanakae TaxID=230148 RepID=A0A4Z2G0P3_9TELE|nr:hypothetical protein EYF80_043736 [Liparis tanakae]